MKNTEIIKLLEQNIEKVDAFKGKELEVKNAILNSADAIGEEKAIAERKAQALSERKHQLDQQRDRLVGSGQGTKGYNKSGIRAKVTMEERLG